MKTSTEIEKHKTALKRNRIPTPSANGTGKEHPKNDPFDAGITLDALLLADLPAVRFVIDGLLPEGLTVLAGRPKQGKSWLAMLEAICTSLGLRSLGFAVARDVLHLALEDTRRRYRDRAAKMVRALGVAPSNRLDVRTSWPRAGSGGLERLGNWFEQHPGGLVIIDTLARFRDPPKGKNSYDEDYRAVSDLKGIADHHGGAVKLVTHTRKCAAEDPFDEVSGTLGIGGAADAIQVLERERGHNSAKLYVTGRDLPDETLSLSWGPDDGLWTIASRAAGIDRLERVGGTNKVDRCEIWLRFALESFAWPDAELMAGAAKAGFTEDNVKAAKAKLRKGDPPLHSKPRGSGGAWWNWIGDRKPDRTEAARIELLHEQTPETPETDENTRQTP